MRRRQFIILLGVAAVWPLAVRAQQPGKVRRIGFISGASRSSIAEILAGFPQGMRELGYVEGRDFAIEWRFADGEYDRFPAIAAELVQLKVDVFVLGTPAAVHAARQATATIPIVMGYSTDPVGGGFVASLARPGGNVTGLASSTEDVIPKQVELLATAVPNLTTLGLLSNPGNPNSVPVLKSAQVAAQKASFAFVSAEARNPEELESAFSALTSKRVQAVVVTSDGFFNSRRQRIVELALSNRLPTMFAQREYVQSGGLMSYGESLAEFFRRAATYVDKIFKGAKPARLTDRTANAVQARDQSQDCRGAWNYLSTSAVHVRGRGDRLVEQMSAIGTKRTYRVAPHMSAFGGKATRFSTMKLEFTLNQLHEGTA